MNLSLIWAMSRNRVIGRDNQLPWRLPEDLKFFKRVTMGCPVIMGRRTFESIGRPLPGRRNVILSRVGFDAPGGVDVAVDLTAAIDRVADADQCFVIGGAEAYRLALPLADTLFCTHVDAEVDGDTFFPEFDLDAWTVTSDESFAADERHAFAFSIRSYQRRSTD